MKLFLLSLLLVALFALVYAPDPDYGVGDLPSDGYPTDLPRRRCGQGFARRFYGGDRGLYGGGRRFFPGEGGEDTSRYYNRRYNNNWPRRTGVFGGPNNDIPDRRDVEYV